MQEKWKDFSKAYTRQTTNRDIAKAIWAELDSFDLSHMMKKGSWKNIIEFPELQKLATSNAWNLNNGSKYDTVTCIGGDDSDINRAINLLKDNAILVVTRPSLRELSNIEGKINVQLLKQVKEQWVAICRK